MKLLLLTVGLFCSVHAHLQVSQLEKYAQYIDSAELKKHLVELAGNEYMGRETGKAGQQKAAEYIAGVFQSNGLQKMPGLKTWEQFFDVTESQPDGRLAIKGKSLLFRKDFFYLDSKRPVTIGEEPVVFDLESNGVLLKKLIGFDVRSEIKQLKQTPHKAIILITDNYADLVEYFDHMISNNSMRLVDGPQREECPVIIVDSKSCSAMLEKLVKFDDKTGLAKPRLKKPLEVSFSLNTQTQVLKSSNVLAFIPGSDSLLKKELVVITAHYDHIGVQNGEVFNGADDDGSGTVAVLEIAQAFSQAFKDGKGPKRSMLFMTVSGEEKGLLGSSYYASHPLWPLSETVTDLNIDMIGRRDIAHEQTANYIYIIGSNMLSSKLHELNEQANNTVSHLVLDYRFNSTTDPNQFYYRSDHYNFAKNDIPSIFFFSGVHDDYHQPTDDVEKIEFGKTEKIARLVFATAWLVANASERPAVDQKSNN